MFVSCRKCLSCRRAYQAAWATKLQNEAKCHLYTYVIHLDYDERHLPKYDFSPDGESLIEITPRLDNYYKKYSHLKTIKFNDLKFDTPADRDYFVDRINSHYTCIPHASVYDIQLFKKRLNTLVKRQVTGKYGSFRSAIVSELGGDTLRPHYHGILYFDDERLKKEFPRLVCEAWTDAAGSPLGHSKFEEDRGKAASYISKYLFKFADIPSFYEHPALRNIFLTSRKPSLGSLFESSSEIREVFFASSPRRVEFKKQGDVWCPQVFPIGQNFESRLFPKCYAYDKISRADRIALYKLYGNGEIASYRQWQCYLFNRIFDFGNASLLCPLDSKPYDFYLAYFLRNEVASRNTDFSRMVLSITRNFETERSLDSLYNVSKRVYLQSQIFGVSVDQYIQHIFKYHDFNKPQFLLRRFYNTQIQVLQNYPNYETDYFYPVTSGLDPSQAPDAKVYFDYQAFRQAESLKNHYAHRYLETKLVQRDPILYNILKKFFYAKECNEALEAIA